jgi:iron complex transport system substrate-binding protein
MKMSFPLHRLFSTSLVGLLLVLTGCISKQETSPLPTAQENCHVIQHMAGETCVPNDPKRVVALISLDNLLALGVKPVGAAFFGFPDRADAGKFGDYLSEQTQGIEVVGHVTRPNLETIARLDPDIIIGRQDHRRVYGKLKSIAPTVLMKIESNANWPKHLQFLGRVFQKQEKATQLLNQYQDKAQQLKRDLATQGKEPTVTVLRFRPDEIRLYLRPTFSVSILQDLGLSGPSFEESQRPFQRLSPERLTKADADVIFYFQDNPNDSYLQQLKTNQLWQQLEAVERDRAYPVSHQIWFLGAGVQAANLVIEDVRDHLLNP